jgi:multidrug efflux pump
MAASSNSTTSVIYLYFERFSEWAARRREQRAAARLQAAR